MTAERGRRRAPASAFARCLALAAAAALAGCASAGTGAAACVLITSPDGGALLGTFPLAAPEPIVTLTYLHSVTRTPVEERYRVQGTTLVQTELRFREHGPGLPTAPDTGQTWTREHGTFVVRLERSHDAIVARVDPDQAPRLTAAAASVDLAQWGRRPIRIAARPGQCPQP